MRRLLFLPFAFLAVQCAEPTNVIIDVRVDTRLCNEVKRTGIAVSTAERVDVDPLEIFEGTGCEAPGDRIGTLVLTPSGADDAEFAVRVVAGVDRPAEQCQAPFEGCIFAKRVERFTPGTSKPLVVILRKECVGTGTDCGGL